jgi:hypothetical protein
MKGGTTRTARADSAAMPVEAVDPARPAEDSGPFAAASREARQLAAVILEVLAGAQSPSEAGRALGISVARYYQLEVRALAGLLAACEDRRRKGRGPLPGGELAALRRECAQLRRECARQQALVRATRRTVGLSAAPAPTPAAEAPAPRRKRRPTARALKMAALLHEAAGDQAEPSSAAAAADEARPEASPRP